MRCFAIFILLFLSKISLAYDGSQKVDFDLSMGKENQPTYRFMFRNPKSAEHYHIFRKVYNSNYYKASAKELQIPKIIHQLWLGGPMPKFFERYIQTCKDLHPGWEYKFWTDKDLKSLSYNTQVVQSLNSRLDITKDYLMHVILEKFGGVFLDVDYACFKPFDQLNYQYDAWFSIEPSGWWKNIPTTSYSIIAAKPFHPVISKTLKDIEQYVLNEGFRVNHNKNYTDKDVQKDKIFASVQFLEGINIVKHCQSNDCGNIMVFPPTYFLPRIDTGWMMDNIKKYPLLDKIRMHLGMTNYELVYDEIKPETIAMNDFNAKAKINPFYYREKYSNF